MEIDYKQPLPTLQLGLAEQKFLDVRKNLGESSRRCSFTELNWFRAGR